MCTQYNWRSEWTGMAAHRRHPHNPSSHLFVAACESVLRELVIWSF